jgi:hypothetical protein
MPPNTVSLLLSNAKIPVESTVKAKTDGTTTKAISMMAVSSPVIPRYAPVLSDGFTYLELRTARSPLPINNMLELCMSREHGAS